MSYKYWFADNESYSAQDLNKMVSRLVTSGVKDPFEDGVPYNLSAVNSAGAILYTAGAVPETVNTLKVVSSGGNNVFINPGTAFFSDGAVMEVEAGGHVLAITPGAKNYVYLKNDLVSSNTCYPACTTDEPTGIHVMLAEVSEIGEITDRRVYAKGKLPGYASNALYTMKIEDSVDMKDGETITKTYDVGENSYRFLMSVNFASAYALLGVYDIESGIYLSYFGIGQGARGGTSDLVLYKGNVDRASATVQLLGGTLTLNIEYTSDGSSENAKYVPFTLYLF